MEARSIYRSAAGEAEVTAQYAELLARWPVPFEGATVRTRQGPTFVLSCGDPSNPLLVLLHGAGSNALMWMGDAAELSQRCRVHAVDIVGEPGRSAAARPPWEGLAYSDWLSDVLYALGTGVVRLAGLSQGEWIALKFATTRPECVERLALLSPAGVVADRLSFLLRALPRILLGRFGARSLNRLVVGNQLLHPDALAFMDLILRRVRPRLDVSPLFRDEELRRLRMPVLLIGVDRDAIRDCEAIGARLARLVPRLEVALISGAGHVLVPAAARLAPFLAAETPERLKDVPL